MYACTRKLVDGGKRKKKKKAQGSKAMAFYTLSRSSYYALDRKKGQQEGPVAFPFLPRYKRVEVAECGNLDRGAAKILCTMSSCT